MQNLHLFHSSTVRKSTDQAKDAKNALRKKVTFFCTIYRQTPSWEDEVREPSVYYPYITSGTLPDVPDPQWTHRYMSNIIFVLIEFSGT